METNLIDFNKTFDEFVSPNKAEESLREFSNWIVGISFSICAFLITESDKFICQEYINNKPLYITILILSMFGAFISGLNKYFILNRDTKLSVTQDLLKRVMINYQLKKVSFETASSEWDKHMKDWTAAFSGIRIIGTILNFSLVLTALAVLLSGLYILLTI